MRRSIRWELPLSYAAIAMLATVALGAVLLLSLRGYYGQLERAYLGGNALALSYTLAPLLGDDPPTESLQAQAVSLSFLVRARVRFLDKDGILLADSSTPGRFIVLLGASPERDLLEPGRGIEAYTASRGFIAIDPALTESRFFTSTGTLPSRLVFEPSRSGDPYGPVLIRPLPYGARDWPLGVAGDTERSGSGPVAQQPVYGDSSNLLGYVELSEGPAYGQEIVASVARGWLLAGAVAVTLAAAVGWWVSRRISAPLLALTGVTTSMAAGDLAARADTGRKDEFGTLARSFNAMADRVEDTVVTLRSFVSDAAHELHTPLATLRANLEMLREDSLPGQGERLDRAQAQVERLEALTKGMLDLSRIEAGVNSGPLGLVSFSTLVQEASELYASRAEQAGLAFELSLPETPVIVRGEETQLRQALANLLDNAIKFTPPGGHVHLGLRREGEMAVLWVEDTGIGIPEEDLALLFQRFRRGRNTEGYPGSGLGLAIVKAIADQHGGSVEAEGSDKGARISLRLPVAGFA